ncbi:hypothetical protein ASD83_12830 [Devosia sp. Root685]|uniref:hypothetical protein n=1 Tax=Devosia sp. Root685 TaxID=1736587 RepID=UPI0006F7461E|nr:hypothetical protein [Devosia sp. Root685]KRA97946.1 hypothetical protein ASD83_12830 [Devosia sp. Root685]
MIKANRSTVKTPPNLHKGRPSDGKTELQLVTEHMAGPDAATAYDFTRYKEATVKDALEQLFHGKCAYCESFYAGVHPVDVEHYRPKGEVDGVAGHRGYWWLAMNWENLLPSCIDCNRRRNQKAPKPSKDGRPTLLETGDFDRSKSILMGKQSIFPLAGSHRAAGPGDDVNAEDRLLLDPTRDDPDDHLVFHVDRDHLISIVYPKSLDIGGVAPLPDPIADHESLVSKAAASHVSAKGMVSVQVYGLNRLGLVQARTRVMRDLEFLLALSINLLEAAIELEVRNDRRRAERPTASPDLASRLASDIAIDERIATKLRRYANETREKIRELTEPRAPYSRLARAWVERYLAP